MQVRGALTISISESSSPGKGVRKGHAFVKLKTAIQGVFVHHFYCNNVQKSTTSVNIILSIFTSLKSLVFVVENYYAEKLIDILS